MARDESPGTIAGATVGAVAAIILMLQDALRPGMGVAPMRSRPVSQTFSQYPANRLSQGRIASTAGTLSDRDSQIGKEYGPDGIVYHHAPPPPPTVARHSTMLSCSPAPSVPSLADAVAVVSRNASPAVAQGPFTPPPEGKPDRSGTFGTLTTEPESLSRSATGSLHGSQSTKGGVFRKLSSKVFARGSTRSSGSESRGTGPRLSDMELDDDRTETTPAVPYLRDDKPPGGGAADEYYTQAAADYYAGAVAPLSPPEENKLPTPGPGSEFIHMIGISGASIVESLMPQTGKKQLGSPFNAAGAPPSPTSPQVKQEELSSEEGERARSLEAQSDTLSPPPGRGLPVDSSPKRFEPPPSPYRPAPGTVNPMDMMKPTTAAEQAAWVDTELWKLENSPPPQLDNTPPPSEPSPPSQTEYYSPSQSPPPQQAQAEQPPTQPDRPHFQAVVRHPTQMDVTTNGQAVPQTDEQVVTDISDTSSPGFDQYTYGPSPSNHTSPETRFTGSNYTASPSPRSSMSNRPSSTFEPTTEYLETTISGQSQGSTSEDRTSASPKPTSFACEICGSKFDQVHKLNHHKRYHERPHQCPQCDKRFGTKTHLDRHINDKHNKTRKYHCTVTGCAYSKQGGGKSFPRKDNWRRHMQNKHQQPNPPEPVEEDAVMTG
ncbi:hypothetical protein INS49_001561 [Diaporthe citri]|uniref:uncharacterized protein n=1 Tax=Diaporthe citri TaxID=83186 RepID=UPI001C7E5682|nr:uncharacterized protein INS49_001561 [Diaporthe citri]KAG6367372.1 hypothetical protein INS49_001561 [Diaporthe citri]